MIFVYSTSVFAVSSSVAGQLDETFVKSRLFSVAANIWPGRLLLQSGRSSLAKHGGAYFSAVNGSIKDPIAAPGPYENQEP